MPSAVITRIAAQLSWGASRSMRSWAARELRFPCPWKTSRDSPTPREVVGRGAFIPAQDRIESLAALWRQTLASAESKHWLLPRQHVSESSPLDFGSVRSGLRLCSSGVEKEMRLPPRRPRKWRTATVRFSCVSTF